MHILIQIFYKHARMFIVEIFVKNSVFSDLVLYLHFDISYKNFFANIFI